MRLTIGVSKLVVGGAVKAKCGSEDKDFRLTTHAITYAVQHGPQLSFLSLQVLLLSVICTHSFLPKKIDYCRYPKDSSCY